MLNLAKQLNSDSKPDELTLHAAAEWKSNVFTAHNTERHKCSHSQVKEMVQLDFYGILIGDFLTFMYAIFFHPFGHFLGPLKH
jgi:hypothetical protein